MNYKDIITIEEGKRGGKPCIRGMRITVYDILDYLASGMSTEEVLKISLTLRKKISWRAWRMRLITKSSNC